MLGLAKLVAAVQINSVNATTRRGEYYHQEVTVANGSPAVWEDITLKAIEGVNQTQQTGHVVPSATETFTYDLDGNLRVGKPRIIFK